MLSAELKLVGQSTSEVYHTRIHIRIANASAIILPQYHLVYCHLSGSVQTCYGSRVLCTQPLQRAQKFELEVLYSTGVWDDGVQHVAAGCPLLRNIDLIH